MIFSNHARARWEERMPELDVLAEVASAKPPGKRLRLLLEGRRTRAARKGPGRARYLISRSGVVFVVSNDLTTVITVFHVRESKQRARQRERRQREWTKNEPY